ncbi:MAG: HNH endonuclease signature motif containing protein [Candidatus Accumulibacter phosphatis]
MVEAYPNTYTAELAAALGLSVTQIYHRAEKLQIKKSAEYMTDLTRRSTANAVKAGTASRFKPGHKTWNKGIQFSAKGRSAETQFQPKNRPHNSRPLGSERTSKEGYLQRKMTETGYPPRDWVPVHHLVWTDAGNGIPKGHRVVFRDGNKRNFELANLELVTIAELMRRNSYHNYGPEIAQVVQLRGAITRQINKHKRNADEQSTDQA